MTTIATATTITISVGILTSTLDPKPATVCMTTVNVLIINGMAFPKTPEIARNHIRDEESHAIVLGGQFVFTIPATHYLSWKQLSLSLSIYIYPSFLLTPHIEEPPG